MSICVQYEKPLLVGIGMCLLLYFFIMDIILYNTFMQVNLVDEKLHKGEMLTVFRPLSVKMIMNDHITHYLGTPLSEGFCYYTNFQVNFYYITPNMITFTHLCFGFLSAKFVFSESLYRRRIGVILYEIRSFLDAFDGTVYRSHAEDKAYKSDHSNLGYWVDVTSDTIAGICMCFAILFTLWWKNPPKKSVEGITVSLPVFADQPKWLPSGEIPDVSRRTEEYSKRFIFWRVFCFGAFWGLSSAIWDQTVIGYHYVFTTHLDANKAYLQSQYLHSTKTWTIMWFWRILGGQAVLQMICIAIFIDKHWELFRLTQYIGVIAAIILHVVSKSHINTIKSTLEL